MMATAIAPDERVELLVFRVAGATYAADASEVVRIARAGAYARLSDALGMPEGGSRALVVLGECG